MSIQTLQQRELLHRVTHPEQTSPRRSIAPDVNYSLSGGGRDLASDFPDEDAPEYAYVGDAGTMWRWAIGLSVPIWGVIGLVAWALA